jgi:hypothetical protein
MFFDGGLLAIGNVRPHNIIWTPDEQERATGNWTMTRNTSVGTLMGHEDEETERIAGGLTLFPGIRNHLGMLLSFSTLLDATGWMPLDQARWKGERS